MLKQFTRTARPLSRAASRSSLYYRPIGARFVSDDLHRKIDEDIQVMIDAGTLKHERVITTPQRAEIGVSTSNVPGSFTFNSPPSP